jgi:hypothetical protein
LTCDPGLVEIQKVVRAADMRKTEGGAMCDALYAYFKNKLGLL